VTVRDSAPKLESAVIVGTDQACVGVDVRTDHHSFHSSALRTGKSLLKNDWTPVIVLGTRRKHGQGDPK
jgi:hypothetical protein